MQGSIQLRPLIIAGGLAALILEIVLPARSQPAPAAVTQPVPYSHKPHMALGIKCQDCHPNPEPGRAMTFPHATKCMACHVSIARDKPSIQKLAELSESERPIPWVQVYIVPNWVSWSHRSHLKAGVKCETCHGDVAQMDVIAKVTNVTKMAGCIECHRQKSASVECSDCHDLN